MRIWRRGENFQKNCNENVVLGLIKNYQDQLQSKSWLKTLEQKIKNGLFGNSISIAIYLRIKNLEKFALPEWKNELSYE